MQVWLYNVIKYSNECNKNDNISKGKNILYKHAILDKLHIHVQQTHTFNLSNTLLASRILMHTHTHTHTKSHMYSLKHRDTQTYKQTNTQGNHPSRWNRHIHFGQTTNAHTHSLPLFLPLYALHDPPPHPTSTSSPCPTLPTTNLHLHNEGFVSDGSEIVHTCWNHKEYSFQARLTIQHTMIPPVRFKDHKHSKTLAKCFRNSDTLKNCFTVKNCSTVKNCFTVKNCCEKCCTVKNALL
jgi:hypothetical protein